MEITLKNYYEILSPRCTVLISTVDKEGVVNAAPFSFVTPISFNPPFVIFASAKERHTLANIRETEEFVLNIVPENLLDNLWICAKPFEKGVNEIKEAGLTEKESVMVKVPGIAECVSWIECKFEREIEMGDHIMVVGRVVYAEGKDEFIKDEQFDISKARPIMHIRSRRFAVAEKIIQVND
ncbi:MAG: flavin reductase family protein [Thermodesulfobacteriota bacterium]|nr:flavin reductase family protein [Thermodesulfobacteriota bacterium]